MRAEFTVPEKVEKLKKKTCKLKEEKCPYSKPGKTENGFFQKQLRVSIGHLTARRWVFRNAPTGCPAPSYGERSIGLERSRGNLSQWWHLPACSPGRFAVSFSQIHFFCQHNLKLLWFLLPLHSSLDKPPLCWAVCSSVNPHQQYLVLVQHFWESKSVPCWSQQCPRRSQQHSTAGEALHSQVGLAEG